MYDLPPQPVSGTEELVDRERNLTPQQFAGGPRRSLIHVTHYALHL